MSGCRSADVVAATDPGSSAASVTVLFPPAATKGRIALLEARESRGAGPPLHRHGREDELIFVLDGRVTFYVGSERVEGAPGTSVLFPRGVEHAYVVTSEVARMLVVLAPCQPGFERCVADLSACPIEPVPGVIPGAEQEIERLVATAARFGVELTRPRPDVSDRVTAE